MFDLSHDVKLTLDMGKLVPILCLECIPGDTHTISCESLLRFAPLVSPVMHRFDVTMHYFFVPNRLVWDNWEKFITNTKDENTGELPAFPTLGFYPDPSDPQSVTVGSLADYMGLPVNLNYTPSSQAIEVSAIPFAAYQCIYNEYYRDQNLINPINYKLIDGDNFSHKAVLTQIRNRAWEHDYFTACLPWAQKGDPVTLPLGDVYLKDPIPNGQLLRDQNGNLIPSQTMESLPSGTLGYQNAIPQDVPMYLDPNGTLAAGSTNINDLRRAFRLQEWLEKAARGGSRYIEWIKVMFGVNSSDKRLQRPEYITGTKSPVVISEVLNTGSQALPQGNMAGHAVSVTSGKYGKYYCEEHGYIIGIMSVLPKPAYFQGIDRTFKKILDPTQYYFSSFANIGEQEVTTEELYAYTAAPNDTFGYIPRYSEYRFQPNRVCGNFRTDLNFWHQARIFANMPQLNEEFITCAPDKRIFAVEEEGVNNLYCQVFNRITSIRPIPKYGTPMF